MCPEDGNSPRCVESCADKRRREPRHGCIYARVTCPSVTSSGFNVQRSPIRFVMSVYVRVCVHARARRRSYREYVRSKFYGLTPRARPAATLFYSVMHTM